MCKVRALCCVCCPVTKENRTMKVSCNVLKACTKGGEANRDEVVFPADLALSSNGMESWLTKWTILKDQFPPHQVITQHKRFKGHRLNSKLLVRLSSKAASAYLILFPPVPFRLPLSHTGPVRSPDILFPLPLLLRPQSLMAALFTLGVYGSHHFIDSVSMLVKSLWIATWDVLYGD